MSFTETSNTLSNRNVDDESLPSAPVHHHADGVSYQYNVRRFANNVNNSVARNPRRQRDAPDQLPFPESRAGSLGYILGVDGANVFAGNGNGSGNYADNDAAEITAYTGPTTAEAHESAMAIEAAAAAAAANGTPYSYWTAGNYDELPLEVRHTGARFPEQPGQSSSPDDERLHREVQAGHRRQERRMAREVERQAAVARGIVKRRRHGGDDGRRR